MTKLNSSVINNQKWQARLVFLFLLLYTFLLYLNLGRDALFDWDEGIYATLGSELLKTGNLFVSTWNQEVWFEKPPGIAWLSGLGQLIMGHNETGARLFTPLLSSLVLYNIYRIGLKLISWRGGIGAMALLAGFNLFLGRARAVNTDMPLMLGITTTISLLLYERKPIYPALAIFFSIWFKGLAGSLSFLIALPLFFLQKKSYLLSFILYALLLIVPWHLYSYLKYHSLFLDPYLHEQVIARVTTPIEFHLESRWFYFQYLYENLGLGVLLTSMLGAIFGLRDFLRTKKLPTLLPLWWLILPLALFTIAKTRIFWYILPAYPALALLSARALEGVSLGKVGKQIFSLIVPLMCLQGLILTARSVEINKNTAERPDRLELAYALRKYQAPELAVLTPPEERLAEAILPASQRLSSSFRYGGMPSVAFYFDRKVKFFYNIDEFLEYWLKEPDPLVLIHSVDLGYVSNYTIEARSGAYLGIRKGAYALR